MDSTSVGKSYRTMHTFGVTLLFSLLMKEIDCFKSVFLWNIFQDKHVNMNSHVQCPYVGFAPNLCNWYTVTVSLSRQKQLTKQTIEFFLENLIIFICWALLFQYVLYRGPEARYLFFHFFTPNCLLFPRFKACAGSFSSVQIYSISAYDKKEAVLVIRFFLSDA